MSKQYDIESIILFSYGKCNLNCHYCMIDKNPALKEVDDILAESFKGDYYIKQLKKFCNRYTVTTVEIWGGEPTFGFDRILPLLHEIINYFPNFYKFFTSTNFSYNGWDDNIITLIKEFGKHPYKNFIIDIQLSCDGPPNINDSSRGIGVTQKCLNNYNKLLDKLQDIPPNVRINLYLKPTLDIEAISMLQTEEAVFNYYDFFEKNFLIPFYKKNIPQLSFGSPLPTLAVPSPVTKNNGVEFKNFCKICLCLENQNLFSYIPRLVPLLPFSTCPLTATLKEGPVGCGTGTNQISILPNNLFCICHLGFMEFIEKYKEFRKISVEKTNKVISFENFVKNTKFKSCLTEEEFSLFAEHMNNMINHNSTNRMAGMKAIVQALANANQIEEKYKNPDMALEGARIMAQIHSYCILDGITTASSIALTPVGLYKQTLNGAADIVKERNKYE